MPSLVEKYPHLKFVKHWTLTPEISYLLGVCEAFVEAIKYTPISPTLHKELLKVSLVKGANATTAIEGNTLSYDDILQFLGGKKLPESREYLQTEVQNVLDAFNEILQRVVTEEYDGLISPNLIKSFNLMIGRNLGEHFDAIPGEYRTDNRIVGNYKCPDHEDVPQLVDMMCEWLKREFRFREGNQKFSHNVIQSIVTHIYLEWIHPFGDGNGRTGRLLEFYILLRFGNPDIASHILSNHYNSTRNEYYRQIQNATSKQDLTDFLVYALVGLRDGLRDTLSVIHEYQLKITWKSLVYEEFEAQIKKQNHPVFKRRRRLMLDWPLDLQCEFNDIRSISKHVMQLYNKVSDITIRRDIENLQQLGLLVKHDLLYMPNIEKLQKLLPQRKIPG